MRENWRLRRMDMDASTALRRAWAWARGKRDIWERESCGRPLLRHSELAPMIRASLGSLGDSRQAKRPDHGWTGGAFLHMAYCRFGWLDSGAISSSDDGDADASHDAVAS